MSGDDKTPDPTSKRQARLKLIGVLVLLLGVSGAGIVYWTGIRSPQASDDPSMSGYNRAERRQMGTLYGKSGLLIDDLFEDLKRPRVQATIIAVVSVLVAIGCFHFARPFDGIDEPPWRQ